MALEREQIQIQLLGELRISRNGVRQPLPPSKKTRALLGYLLLTGRAQRRDALCNLFWDVADDPRGALRWSLSKLRPLLDGPGAARLAATREAVAIELSGAEVDALELRRTVLAAGNFQHTETSLLERWASASAGELLEGLDLPDFDEFQAFCLAQREEMRRLRVRVLSTLSARLRETPERELHYVRSWVAADPLSLSARTRLFTLLKHSGRGAEALLQYQTARRLFVEHGSRELSALERAFQQLSASAPSAQAVVQAESAPQPARLSRPSLWLAAGDNEVIGRAAELAFLRDQLRATVREGRAKVALISGEPGIGKSHLLSYFARWAGDKGFRVKRSAAQEGARLRPYGVWFDCLQTPRDQAAHEQGTAQREESTASDLLRERSPAELLASAAQLVVRQAQGVPALCVILEDVHWMDRASAQLLQHLLRDVARVPLLVVLSLRSEEAADNAALAHLLRSLKRDGCFAERLLPALDVDAIAALLRAEDSELDPERVAFQAGGNPLFTLELARLGERADEQLPESLAEVVRERLARLGAEAAEALRWGAVLEGAFSPAELARHAQLEGQALVTGLEQLESAALLHCEADPRDPAALRFRFAHELVRRAVYAELSPVRRQFMHARVARALHERADYREQQLSRLVRHAALAHDHALAAEACVVAGTHCLRLFAYAEASALARRGLKHCEQLDGLERIRRSIELLEIELWCAQRGETSALSERIRHLGEEAHAFGAFEHARRAHKVLSYRHLEDEAFAASRHHALMAELISRAAEPHEQLASLAEAGRCMLLMGREHERAVAMLAQADGLAARLRCEPAALRDGQGLAQLFRGEYERAAPCFERAAQLAALEQNPLFEFQALEHRALLEFERRDFAAAARATVPLLHCAHRLKRGSELPFAQLIAAMAAYALDPERAGEVERWLRELRAYGAERRLMHASAKLAELEALRARPARALRHARETLALAQRLERPNEYHVALSIIAYAERQLGNDEAERRALALLRERGEREVALGARQRMRALLAAGSEPELVASSLG